MLRASYFRNPFIGVFAKANDALCLVPIDASTKLTSALEEELKVPVLKVSIACSNLIGLYTAMNNKGLALPFNIEPDELDILKQHAKEQGMETKVFTTNLNAWGNNVLLNNKGGFFNPELGKQIGKELEDLFGVEMVPWDIPPFKTPGSAVCVNDHGAVVHHEITEEALKEIKDVLKVGEIERGTINKGVGFIGYGVVCNNKGLVVGEATTGFEMGEIAAALGFVG